MSVYDNFADAPNQIKIEGQEITIRFQRTSDTTARISWNIPPPAHGCASGTQAYDGIVITSSNTPANYISTSPKNGVYYDGDLTADLDLHSGSVLDKAIVLSALYHDKTTTFIDIDGIKPKTPYYVSGYAVDSVGRYHREGVHAYSLPTGAESYDTENFPAQHKIELYSTAQLTGRSLTGLVAGTSYNLPIKMECKVYDIAINGSDATTFTNLVQAINQQFALLWDPYAAPSPPHTGSYYKNPDTGAFYIWDGARLLSVNVLSSISSPSTPTNGMYWLNTISNVLSIYSAGSWIAVPDIIRSATEPTELSAYDIWYDGTTVREWENSHWCDYVTIASSVNPQCAPNFNADDYWYKTTDKELFGWNDKLQRWDDALVIYTPIDPNLINTGTYWYNETSGKVNLYVASAWGELTDIAYVDSVDGEYPSELITVGGYYWYDTLALKLYQRNLLNTAWVELSYISYPTDPKVRSSCDLWWNSSPSVDDLFAWEAVTSMWKPVGTFYRQATDPNVPPILDEHTAWVKPNGEISLISASACTAVNYITSSVNPRNIVDNMVWLDDTGNYYVYDSGNWNTLDVILRYPSNPYTVVTGMLWYDMINLKLFKFDTTWVEQCLFVDNSLFPTTGQQWFNTVDDILFEWNGSAWVITCPNIKVMFTPRTCADEYEALEFSTKNTGCHESFEVMSENNTLFANLSTSVIYNDAVDGWDGVDAGAMFTQLGVGTDGTPDERRQLHEAIRMTFGAPSIRVELTKQQLDECINNALLVLRKHSTYAYKKGMFFLDLKPFQQVYKLTNKCVGFNKIVDVTCINRTKAGAFKTAYGSNDNFAQAAMQQLYTMGTFDMLTYHLASSYVEELETLFASRIMYQWLERKRELRIYQTPRGKERVLLEVVVERLEQELLSDRETAYWIKRWAIVEAKGMLAQIRGKFATLPGPNGSTQLNASDLQTQLQEERQQLMDEVYGNGMQDLTDVGMKAHFLMG